MSSLPELPGAVELAVVGAHLDGQPLNAELTSRGGRLVRGARTAPRYHLYALETVPPKPGLVRVGDADRGGASIEVEVWELAMPAFGAFVASIPAPLGIGKVELDDGSVVAGFICETVALDGALDITRYGGWRPFLAARS